MQESDSILGGVSVAASVISFFSLLVSLATYSYVVRQVGLLRSQIQIDAGFKIAAVNRELLGLAFEHNELFCLFEDKPFTDFKQRHYIQMWINHIDSMWRANEHKLIEVSQWYAMKKDIADFYSISLVREHWEGVKTFYTPEFVQFITEILRQNSPK